MKSLCSLIGVVGALVIAGCGEENGTLKPGGDEAPKKPEGGVVPEEGSKAERPESEPSAGSSSGAGLTTDWSQFRGPNGNGQAPDADLPVNWGPDQGVVWKKELPGPGASSPIVFGDKVFVTCHTGYGLNPASPGEMGDLERHLLCFRLSDGEPIWMKSIPAKQPEGAYAKRMHWHGYASQTPAADADAIYCFFGKSGVCAFDHSGELLWEQSVGTETHGWGSGTSPVLFEDLVIVNAFVESGALVALDKKTGDERWRAEGLKESWNTPALVQTDDGATEVAVGVAGKVLGFHPKSGEPLWEAKAADWYVVPSIVWENGILYSLSGKGYEAATAIKAGGRGEVTGSHRLWQTRKGSNVSSAVLHDGRLYFAHEQGSTAYCLDAKSGDEIYQERIPARMSEIYASPIVASERIYYFGRNGTGLVVKAGETFEVLLLMFYKESGEVVGGTLPFLQSLGSVLPVFLLA